MMMDAVVFHLTGELFRVFRAAPLFFSAVLMAGCPADPSDDDEKAIFLLKYVI